MALGDTAAAPRIVLRMIVRGNHQEVGQVWQGIANSLVDLGPGAPIIRPYPKLTGTEEIATVFHPSVGDPNKAYDTIARRLATGWTAGSADAFARWSVWNQGEGQFCDVRTVWAHLELIKQ